MERLTCFNEIEARLSYLVARIECRASCNILDLNIHSEDFYMHFLNLLFAWKLENMNTGKHNAVAIDLIDNINKILVQVSATATKQKIDSTLSKDLAEYTQYNFKFISISKDASHLCNQNFYNPHKIQFTPAEDIYDVKKLLNIIKDLKIETLKEVEKFIKSEIFIPPTQEKVELNISNLISLLAKENWGITNDSSLPKPFDIDKKIEFNKLISSKNLINNFKDHHHRIDRIYTEFDKQGKNKSLSVLSNLNSVYRQNLNIENSDECFNKIIDDVIFRIKQSLNYTPIPEEELRLYVELITVDAFIRCKIFENPEGYYNVITR